jgi:hypothetical protein
MIDDVDFPLVSPYTWHAHPGRKHWYAATTVKYPDGRYALLLMHRLILGARSGQIVDHANYNGLDNQRSNLRFCTESQNRYNCTYRKRGRPDSSRYKGVYWDKQKKKWRAEICAKGKKIRIGAFSTEKDAALAYDNALYRIAGPFARPNFPKN